MILGQYTFVGRTLPEQVVLNLGRHTFKGTVGDLPIWFEVNFHITTSVIVAEVEELFLPGDSPRDCTYQLTLQRQ